MDDYLYIVIIVISIIWSIIQSLQKKKKKASQKPVADTEKPVADTKKKKGLFAKLNQHLQEQMQAIEKANNERQALERGDGDDYEEDEYDADPWIPKRKEPAPETPSQETVSPANGRDLKVESSRTDAVEPEPVPGLPAPTTGQEKLGRRSGGNVMVRKLRKAIIWSEILAPPVSERKLET